VSILKKYFYPGLAFVVLFIVLSYRLFHSFNFHPDFARDIYDILTIIQGKLTLIGPKLSFGGIYSGPYYYYLLAPVFFVTGLNLNSLLVFNLMLFIGGAIFFYWLIPKKNGRLFPLAAALLISCLPMYVTGARGPWNGSTYLPFLLAFLSMVFFVKLDDKKLLLAMIGFVGGMVINIHLVSTPVVFIGLVYLAVVLKRKSNLVFLMGGFLAAFLPLLLFEIKHDFVMTKNTFLVGSYKTFVENNNIPNAVSGKKNFIENLVFLANKLSGQLGVNILFYWGTSVILFFKTKFRERFLIAASFILVFLFSAVLKYQFGGHYLYPVSMFLAFSLTLVLIGSKYKWLLFMFIILELVGFPRGIYSESGRVASTFKKRVEYTLDQKLIKNGESFNVIQISKDYTAYIPVGHEYRFYFRKYNYVPKTEFEYNQSDTLLIYSELKDFDIAKLNNWEVGQFGKANMNNYKKYDVGGAALYVFRKTK
jgi:hypothetical protein